MRRILIVLVLSVFMACVAVGKATGEPSVTYDELVEAVAFLSDLLDRASYLAIAGFSAYDAEDKRVAAQELVNLFEGPSGPNYESQTTDVVVEDGLGILASFESLKNADVTGWLESTLSNQFFVIRDVFWNTEHFLRLAYVSSLEALRIAYSLIGPKDAFRTSYAFLLAARGKFDDPFLVAGIQKLQSVLTSVEVRALQGDSIQAAIDFLPDGGTLQLNAGVYHERLILTKSITIRGALPDDAEAGSNGGTVLEGVAWDPVVLVNSDEPITVVFEDLTIKGGSSGVVLGGGNYEAAHSLCFVNVSFVNNGKALATWQPTQIQCANCLFDGNGSVVHAQSRASATLVLDACVIQGGSDPDGDIFLGTGELVMRNSELRRVAGNGIVLVDTASMTLINSTIETNYAYAISVRQTIGSLSDEARSPCGFFLGSNDDNLPMGTITGYGNTISGGVCPVSLLFLTEPGPTEMSVSPGQSIQAAIDSVADGGTVYIEPGTYLEVITIDKSLSLISATDDSEGEGESRDVILGWDVGGTVISISSSVPIDVALSGLTFQGENAGWGINVGENATVEMQNMMFHDLGTAIDVKDGGSVTASHCGFTSNGSTIAIGPRGTLTASWCTFADNRQAISAFLGSVCTLTDCDILRCAAEQAALSAWCSDLTLENCVIRDNQGNGVRLGGGEASRLHMIDCQISSNAFGVEFVFGSCNPGDDPEWEAPTSLYDKSHGTATGWNNYIPGPDEPDGNSLGSFEYYHRDLLDPTFLTEPKPGDE